MLWVPFTLAAAFAQVLRNAYQARLTQRIGTLGGTQVRFVYGLPFAILMLAVELALSPDSLPPVPAASLGWAVLGAAAQIVATAMMLTVMKKREFGVAYAYIKTEPVTVAVLGFVLIGDRLPLLGWIAVVVVTLGVVLASLRDGGLREAFSDWRAVAVGVGGGALFGLSAIAFRGSIDAVPEGSFITRALTMLAISLAIQTAMLAAWFILRGMQPLSDSVREWRLSVTAGFLGALASAGWFMSFALTNAANVRTLALIEMPFVAFVSYRLHGRWLSPREWVGFTLVTLGVTLLLLGHPA